MSQALTVHQGHAQEARDAVDVDVGDGRLALPRHDPGVPAAGEPASEEVVHGLVLAPVAEHGRQELAAILWSAFYERIANKPDTDDRETQLDTPHRCQA